MVGAGGAIINYLFPGAREAPESKGAENIVSMEDIRLEQGLHEECGVFGIYDPEGSCAQTTYYGLYALQHRGQEACGIAAINDREQSFYKDVGLVSEVFDRETLQRLNGTMAVGHVRYATTGAGARENAQPLTIKYVKGTLAVVHNGNLVDVDRLRARFGGNLPHHQRLGAHCLRHCPGPAPRAQRGGRGVPGCGGAARGVLPDRHVPP